MRSDALGLFWEDYGQQSSSSKRERIRPPVPVTGWVRPKELPNLARAKVIGLDLETKDPNLTTMGPGNVRAGEDGERFDGYICGIAVATEDAKWYIPTRHPESENFDEDRVYAWAKKELARPTQPKVGANLMYDVGWLHVYDVEVAGPLYDVQVAEPLIDEEAVTYDLDYIMGKYLGRGKETSLLYEWCSHAFGGAATSDQRKNIWRCPASLVGPYAEEDVQGPLEVIRKQWEILKKEGLVELFKMESSLLPLLIKMRFRGVRVDVAKAEQTQELLKDEYEAAQQELDEIAGQEVNVNAGESIAEACEILNLNYRRIKRTGKASFRKSWLKEQAHPLFRGVLDVRKLRKAADTFVESYILSKHVDGRLHAQFHPLRTDTNGTVSGRFASSLPNLQNIPKRDERMGPLIRGLFIPDEDFPYWRRFDYSQIEYRLLAHFASGPGAEEVRVQYNRNPDIDFHEMVTQLVFEITEMLMQRELTKNVNFGLCIAKGQLVKTQHGDVPIEKITQDHLLWDGANWIRHGGLIRKGIKNVITYQGLTATPDHNVWVDGYTEHVSLSDAATWQKELAQASTPRKKVDHVLTLHRYPQEVYDILNAGPRRRFTCSNVLVSNCYGMAQETLRAYLGITEEQAKKIFNAYHRGAPFVVHTYNHYMNEARAQGYITTILKRRRRFNWYESAVDGVHGNIMKKAEAKRAYGFIKPAYTHKALNAELQGSAADIIKQAMCDAYYAGVFDVTGVPHMQVHDELGFSDEDTPETNEAFEELKHIMENCVKLKVPMVVDWSRGATWADCK